MRATALPSLVGAHIYKLQLVPYVNFLYLKKKITLFLLYQKNSYFAEWAITFCNCTLSLMSVAMGSWGASGAGTSLTYVLCRSGHISAGFSASGNGWTFSRLLVVCIHLILPRPQLGMATGQLWGFGTLLDSQAVSFLFLHFFLFFLLTACIADEIGGKRES